MTTNNPEYNELLCRWRAQGCETSPECEECGRDLRNQDVHDTGIAWVCSSCFDKGGYEPSDEDLRRHERKQLGIT